MDCGVVPQSLFFYTGDIMKLWQYSLIILSFYLFFAVILKSSKKKKPLRRAFLIMLSGNVFLLLVDLLSGYTGVYLPLSALSIAASACGGVPAVATMLVINWLL